MESNSYLNQASIASTLRRRFVAALDRQLSLETLLFVWFFITPFASFYLRFPTDKSLITFDRAVFASIGLLLFARYVLVRNVVLRAVFVTKFEIVWALLSALVLVSAVLRSNNTGFALRIAVDAFVLPLIAFHAARYHVRLGGRERLLFFATAGLAACLFVTGAFEYRTGINLFAYKGSEIFRDGELRVNGPFLSDSSYAIICLLVTLFLRLLPRLCALKFDRSARLVYLFALAMSVVATLLPLFRTIAFTLVLCWVLIEALLLLEARRHSSRHHLVLRVLQSKRLGVYVIALVLLFLAVTAWQELSGGTSFARRLTSPRNVYGRLATWQTAARIALENPLFGVGLNNYTDYFDQKFTDWRQQRDALADTRAANTPHSNVLWIFAEFGVIGLALYLLAFAYLGLLGYRLLKRASTARQFLAGGGVLVFITAYTIPGLTLQSGAYWDLNLYFFFMLGLFVNKGLGSDS
jgi:O-antigen ligase